MPLLFIILFVAAIFAIWYFTDKKPNQIKKTIAVCGVMLSIIGLFAFINDPEEAEIVAKPQPVSSTNRLPKTGETKTLPIYIANEFTTDQKGRAFISGDAPVGTTVTIKETGFSLTTTENYFSLPYQLTEQKDQLITVLFTKDDQKETKTIRVIAPEKLIQDSSQ